MPSGAPSWGNVSRVEAVVAALPARRSFPLIVAALAVILALPALRAGWILDDYYHRVVLLARSPYRDLLGPPAEMFRFFRGDPVRTGLGVDMGAFPWWTDLTLKAEFLQAITVLTHRVDYALWPDSPVLMHAQSLFWLATLVAAVATYYRRMFGLTSLATVAAFLYAVDDARGTVAGFIANRNILITATFGVSALVFHDRYRRDGSRLAALLAPLLLAAALFSKEEGIGTCAYLVAYALFVDSAGRWRGALALLPYGAVVVAWRAIRAHWGYGVHNMGLYVDPLSDPLPFVADVARNVPLLLSGQWSPVPAETAYLLGPPRSDIFWWSAVAFAGLVIFALGPLLARDRLARFWAAGMLFATIPACAARPMDRLLTFAGIGAFGLLAQFWALVFSRPYTGPALRAWRVPARALAWFFVAVHAVWAPFVLPFRAANPLGPWWVNDRLHVHATLPPTIGEKTLVIVNVPSAIHASYVFFRRAAEDEPVPRHLRLLAPAAPAVTIRRLDDRTLEIRPERGYFWTAFERLFRNERRDLALGAEVKLTGMTARVTELTPDRRPAVVTFRFDDPLESPSFVWLCYRGNRFEPFVPPAVGRAIEIRFNWSAVFMPPYWERRASSA
jgi:hypothetical protein